MVADLILFVEDNTDFRDSAARFLELNGFEVIVATDGVEGLEVLAQDGRIPDVIVSDISMPRMNGYEFFEAVRQKSRLKAVPFIFLTALDARADMRLGWEIGVDEYLVKPFRPEDFLTVVRNRLKRVREIQSLAEGQLEETRNMIVRILSHELRTPLTYVTGGFTLLADEINKQQEEVGGVGRRDVQNILDLIHNGTDRLNHVIEGAVNSMMPYANECQITLELDHMPSFYVEGVTTLLLSAVTEPIRNSIQYSEAGDVVNIKANADPENPEYVIIEIIDEGRGIAESDLALIWELMTQSGRNEYEQQGFGLGLPIVQRIMQLHHGAADVQSEEEIGTIVRLRLPLKEM